MSNPLPVIHIPFYNAVLLFIKNEIDTVKQLFVCVSVNEIRNKQRLISTAI
jgi:hypothetical protein